MAFLKKSVTSLLGGTLMLLGLIFMILPGPSLLFILPGLFILSYEYPVAKIWLRKCMKLMNSAAHWLDQKMRGSTYH